MTQVDRADQIIEQLELLAHPEGGYYKETYKSTIFCDASQGSRNIQTVIYFMLKSGQKSAFHRLKSDEFWYFHEGSSLEVFIIYPDGKLETVLFGGDCLNGEVAQLLLPSGTWFSARCLTPQSYCLLSCSVAPGFDFADFELATTDHLEKLFPIHTVLIREMT
jgi:uncharacterized protein